MARKVKTYQTFADAEAACQDNGYSNNDLTKVVLLKNNLFRSQLHSTQLLDLSALRTLIGLAAVNTKNNSLNVIDFGGGAGYHHTIASCTLDPNINLKWNVVETKAMVNQAKMTANQNLKFFDNLTEAATDLGSVDLIFTSSALQYCPNPLAYLTEITNLNSKYIYITKTPFINSDVETISTQTSKLSHNGPGPLPPDYKDKKITYPITFSSKTMVEKILKEKYNIRFCVMEDKAVFKVGKQEIDLFGYFCVRKT
jgi:putative methyltransferase (TIGR04325 family)